MRKIFPLKPASACSNSIVTAPTTHYVQKDKGLPEQPTSGSGKDEQCGRGSVEVRNNARDNLKGLKQNSLRAQLRREHSIPAGPLPSGEENFPFAKDKRTKIGSKLNSGKEFCHRERRQSSSSSSIFSTFSSQENSSSVTENSERSTGSRDVLLQGAKSASLAVACNGHVEDTCMKRANENTKLHWMKRSISMPKGHSKESYVLQRTASRLGNSLHLSEVPERFFDFSYAEQDTELCSTDDEDKSTMGELAAITVKENGAGTDSSRLSHKTFLKNISVEVPNVRGLIRSHSVNKLTDSYDCLPHLAGKHSAKQHTCANVRPVVTPVRVSSSSSRNSVADRFSCKCQSAQTIAETLVRSLPGYSKSLTAKLNNTDIKKPFIVEYIAKDEDGDVAAMEVSVSASEHLKPHSCSIEEEISSKLFEDSPPSSQGLHSEDHSSANESISGFLESSVNLRERQEDGETHRTRSEGYEKIADCDDELEGRAKVAEGQVLLLSKEIESVRLYDNGMIGKKGIKKTGINVELSCQRTKDHSKEMSSLVLEGASEIRNRMSERPAANEALELVNGEIEGYVKMVEKKKNVRQFILEKELDRRARNWDAKLEKIKLEEKRLRNRVQDLAEQNVGLQREVLYLNKKENNLQSQLSQSEIYVDSLKTRLKEADNEITKLRQSLTETWNQAKLAADNLHSVKRGYDMKEQETYALQKLIIILQRMCKGQERTITGLSHQLADMPEERKTKLQQELLRPTIAGQALCYDLVTSRCQIDALRQENANLLERLRRREEGSNIGLIQFDQELFAQSDGLQTRALSLLDENYLLCAKLLETIKNNMQHTAAPGPILGDELESGLDGQKRIVVLENEMNMSRMKRKVDFYNKSVQMINEILKGCNETVQQDMPQTEAWRLEFRSLEAKEQFDQLKQELIDETLLSRFLRESLCLKNAEVEQLQEEVATLIRSQDLCKSEIVRLQDLLCTANQTGTDLQLMNKGKEERISYLENDLQRCLREVTVLKKDLSKVLKERDINFQQAEQLRREAMRLNNEIEALRNKAERLEEDVMEKDGQISILKETLAASDFMEVF